MKLYNVTRIDLRNNGYAPTNVYTFSTREKAVAKMKELFHAELERYGLSEKDDDGGFDIHADWSDAPFLPYAYCHETYIDLFESYLDGEEQ